MKLIPEVFCVDLPDKLINLVEEAKTMEEITKTGVQWAIDQTKELYEANVPCIHFYIMLSAKQVVNVVKEFK